jgi:hypothetical protein
MQQAERGGFVIQSVSTLYSLESYKSLHTHGLHSAKIYRRNYMASWEDDLCARDAVII